MNTRTTLIWEDDNPWEEDRDLDEILACEDTPKSDKIVKPEKQFFDVEELVL